MKSVILAFPIYTQLLCINADLFFSSTKYLSSCQLKGGSNSVHFKVALIRLQGNIISSSFKNVLNS